MSDNLRRAFGLCLALFGSMAPPAMAADPEQQAQAMIGLEYVDVFLDEAIPGTECANLGGGGIDIDGQSMSDWVLNHVSCGKRIVYLLERRVTRESRAWRLRIVDTFLLPPLKKGVRLYHQGDCELDGKTDTEFFALVRLGKHDRVDYRTGVLGAWSVDLDAGKIVPVATRRVVCYRPTPP